MSHIFLPDQEPEDEAQKKPQINSNLLRNMYDLAFVKLTSSDLAGINPGLSEKPQYTHSHKSIKRKGGSPPKDYLAVESLIDLQRALQANNYAEAVSSYFFLRRLISG